MKKFLVLVVVVLALFTVDHPMIKEPRDRLLGNGVGMISDAAKVNRSPAANMAKNNIKSQLQLSESEQQYIEDSFVSDEQLQIFHVRYCREKDINLYFYGERLNKVCSIVINALEERLNK
ncbi:hypothetical protein [Pseudoalteromonas mariniglutinosa]|uniref:hypothetical protein n=1 Tax=Pseudoalteromonas mariniglutinosa TaxID=206042 RepID=UPI00384A9320